MATYGSIRFRLHGIKIEGQPDHVDARVFSLKFQTLLTALTAADYAANNKVSYDYSISQMVKGSADVRLQEELRPKLRKRPSASSISALGECLSAATRGRKDVVLRYSRCARAVRKMAADSGRTFSYAEIWLDSKEPFRVDSLLAEQIDTAIDESSEVKVEPEQWFRGFAEGTFDGKIMEVDLRGALPQVKLVLTSGGQEVDCICRGLELKEITEVLTKRVTMSGRAFYDGSGGLPRRIDATSVSLVKPDADFARWGGSFDYFESPEWMDESP